MAGYRPWRAPPSTALVTELPTASPQISCSLPWPGTATPDRTNPGSKGRGLVSAAGPRIVGSPAREQRHRARLPRPGGCDGEKRWTVGVIGSLGRSLGDAPAGGN